MTTQTESTYKKLPEMAVILRLIDQDFTHEAIAKMFGTSKSAVSKAVWRAGKTTENPRYDAEIPWMVLVKHELAAPLRYLRLEARRRRGMRIDADSERRLDQWLTWLKDNNLVVGYDPELPRDPEGTPPGEQKSYGSFGGWFVAQRDSLDAPWPNLITDRNRHGEHRPPEMLRPANRPGARRPRTYGL